MSLMSFRRWLWNVFTVLCLLWVSLSCRRRIKPVLWSFVTCFSPSYSTAGGRRRHVSLTETQHVAFPLFRPVITSVGNLPPWIHFFPDWPGLKSLCAFLCLDWLIRPQFVPVWGQWIHLFPTDLLESHLKGTRTLSHKLNSLVWISSSRLHLVPKMKEHRSLVQWVRRVFETCSSQYQMKELISSPETNSKLLFIYPYFSSLWFAPCVTNRKVPITERTLGETESQFLLLSCVL